jgi:hypothetical protein
VAFEKYGGSYVNCWIRADSPEEAGRIADRDIEDDGWLIEGVRKPMQIETTPSESTAKYFIQAEQDGACYVFHTWPVGEHGALPLH